MTTALELDDGCASSDAPWSIIGSASGNAALAGTLAGLLLTVIAILVIDHNRTSLYAPTLGLFTTTLVALTLDAYIYANISGIRPQEGIEKEGCIRAWIQGTYANGVLAAGALAMVSGIGWVLAAYVVRAKARSDLRSLVAIGGTLIAVVMMVTNLLALQGGLRYVDIIDGGQNSTHLAMVARATTAISLIIGLSCLGVNTWLSVKSFAQDDGKVHLKNGLMLVPTLTLLIGSGASCVFAGHAANLATSSPPPYVVYVGLLFGMFLPNVMAILLGIYSPRLAPGLFNNPNAESDTLEDNDVHHRPESSQHTQVHPLR